MSWQEFYVADALDGREFVLEELHRAYHHYIKVVGTMYEVPSAWGKNELLTYQMLTEVRCVHTIYLLNG